MGRGAPTSQVRHRLPSGAMRLAKLALACGLTVLAVSACGIKAKPVAGTPNIDRASGNHARVDDPRVRHAKCLRTDLRSRHLAVHEYRTPGADLPAIQVGSPPAGPTIIFEPTPGIAQGIQIKGQAQGAEVVGAALVYPNGASDKLATIVEGCVALGVTG